MSLQYPLVTTPFPEANPMHPEDVVAACYPQAQSRYHETDRAVGQPSAYIPAYWSIHAACGPSPVLGQGPNEQAAWQAAATHVQADAQTTAAKDEGTAAGGS